MSRKLIRVLSLQLAMLAACAAFAEGNVLAAADMPRLERAVVFPPVFSQSILSNPRMADFRSGVQRIFPEAVKSSGRFRVIDAELTRNARTDEKIRADLIEQFEVDGFVSLDILDRTDTVDFVVRLFDRKLEPLLQESDSVDVARIDSAGEAGIKNSIEGLVYRLFNRVPYDAKILSMQGRFLVVSGGLEQGVQVGDEIKISRVAVTSRHPATGAWNKFSVEALGSAQVAEVKDRTSIARMTGQIKPGAVRVGDGVKLPRIASRARFAREAAVPSYGPEVLGSGTRPIPVEPLTPQLAAGNPEKVVQTNEKPAVVNPVPAAPAAVSPLDSPVATEEQVTPAASVAEEEGGVGGGRKESWFGSVAAGIFSEGELGLGLRSWSVTGPVSASTAAPYTLVNNIGLRGTRRLSREAFADMEADFSFGSSLNGSFTGYDLRGNGYLEYPVDRESQGAGIQFHRWRYGGVGRLVGLSVSGEKFGGLDAFFFGGFVGGRGDLNVGDKNRKLGIQGDVFLYPLTVGSYGYKGVKQSIDSALGTGIEVKLFRPADAKGAAEYGLTWQYESHSFQLGNSKTAVYDSSKFYLGIRSEL